MAKIFPVDFEEKLTMAQDDYILFSDSEDGNKIKKAQYSNLKWEQGDPGTPGADWAAATITVGTVTTWAAGTDVEITNTGTSSAAILNFTIPQWAKWEPWKDGEDWTPWADWEAATITVGTTTTLAPGSSATVTNVGTSSAAVLNFWIPKGEAWTGTGDVSWPASSTDWHLAVFDWATGKLIKDWGSVPTSFAPDSAGTQWQVLTKWASGYDWATVSGWDVQVSTDTGNLLSTGVKLWLGDKSDFNNLGSLDANTIYAPIEWIAQPRTPSANTIAYFPLAEDWLDVMWNYSLSYTWTQQTVGRLFTQQSELSSIPTGVGTTLIWMYINNKDAASSSNYVQVARNTSWNLNLFISWTANAPCFSLYIPNTTYKAGGGVITTGNWYLIAMTRVKVWSTTTIKGYINWTEYTIYSGTGASNDADYAALIFANGTVDMVLSEYIIESKVWTADEITTYYNQTKWNYGL